MSNSIERRPSYASVVAGTHRDPQHTAAHGVSNELQAEPQPVVGLQSPPAQQQPDASTDSECGRYIDPEDPAYRGRNAKNRVEGAATTYKSIIQTRAAKAAVATGSPSGRPALGKRKPVSRQQQDGADEEHSSAEQEGGSRRIKKARKATTPLSDPFVEQEEPSQPVKRARKRSRAPNVVESPAEEVSSSEEENTNRKRKKTARNTVSDHEEPAPLSERARGKQPQRWVSKTPPPSSSSRRRTDPRKLRSRRRRSPTPLTDAEGTDIDDAANDQDVNMNEYDLEDDFIDDSELRPVQHARPLKRSGAVSSLDQQPTTVATPPQTPASAWRVRTDDASPPASLVSPAPQHLLVSRTPSATQPDRATFASSVSALASGSQASPGQLQSAFTTPRTPSQRNCFVPPTPVTPSPNASSQQGPTNIPSTSIPVSGPLSAATGPMAGRTRRAFGAVIATQPPVPNISNTPPPSTLDNVHYRRVTELPSTCQVTNPALQDPILAAYYVGLPPLRHGMFQPWTDNPGPGMVQFSKWADQCPTMSFDSCVSAIEFRSFRNFVNPARASPLDYCVREYPSSRPRFHLHTADHQPAICVSAMLCKESHVLEPSTRGVRHKYILGIHHSQEYERNVGFHCTTFEHEVLLAQMGMDSIQFATKADFSLRGDGSSPGSRGMYSNMRSPSVASRSRGGPVGSTDNFSLECDAEIPVYDCRSMEIDFRTDLANLATFPRWADEIPAESFVVVGYTVAVYKNASGNWCISFNLQWVIILGIPESA